MRQVQYILSSVDLTSLPAAVQKMRDSGCVPLGVLSYDPQTDSIHISIFTDVMDIGEANALLSKYNLAVTEEEK